MNGTSTYLGTSEKSFSEYTPMTPASAIFGCVKRTASNSAGATMSVRETISHAHEKANRSAYLETLYT